MTGFYQKKIRALSLVFLTSAVSFDAYSKDLSQEKVKSYGFSNYELSSEQGSVKLKLGFFQAVRIWSHFENSKNEHVIFHSTLFEHSDKTKCELILLTRGNASLSKRKRMVRIHSMEADVINRAQNSNCIALKLKNVRDFLGINHP